MKPVDIQRFPPKELRLKNDDRATLRLLSPKDGGALAEFYKGVPLEDIRFYCPHRLDREQALANAAKAHSPMEVVLVVETMSREIGGYAWYRWREEKSDLSTFGICVSRAWQGRGVGEVLMTRLLEIAREVGPPTMSLTVQLANERAVRLYRKMGFIVVREQMRGKHLHGFAPEPEYYMERRVR